MKTGILEALYFKMASGNYRFIAWTTFVIAFATLWPLPLAEDPAPEEYPPGKISLRDYNLEVDQSNPNNWPHKSLL